MISIDACDNQTYNGMCKNDQEINEFLALHEFFVGHQKILMDRLMKPDSEKINPKFSNGEKSSYFPS